MKSLEKKLNAVAEDFHLDAVYLFGSRAREAADRLQGRDAETGNEVMTSDLDIGVKPLPGVRFSAKEKSQLACVLEDLFSVARVDLVLLPEADPFLAANVIRGERVFYRDSDRADEYDLYILRRAGDLAPLERERIAMILEDRA
jgi:predicted nucleotidyltransferase